MKMEIWYSVQNGGDGSAYPQFMESEEQCKLDQKHMDEGWGEPCLGCIYIESKSPITIKTEILTIAAQIKELKEHLEYDDSENLQSHIDALIELKRKGMKDE